MVPFATALLLVLAAYLLIGLVWGLWFVSSGARKLDAAAGAGPWSFKLIILPGVAALWPVLLLKIRSLYRNPHSPAHPEQHA